MNSLDLSHSDINDEKTMDAPDYVSSRTYDDKLPRNIRRTSLSSTETGMKSEHITPMRRHSSHSNSHDSCQVQIITPIRPPSPSPIQIPPPIQLPQAIPSTQASPESTARRRTSLKSSDELSTPVFHHDEKISPKHDTSNHTFKPDIIPTKMTVSCGHFSMQGIRNEMEDKVTLLPHPEFNQVCELTDDIQRSFFAVFDGHGGDVSAEYCHQHVHHNLIQSTTFGTDPVDALRQALVKTDDDFCSACRRIHLVTSSGTTAITTYIENNTLIVANIGDSRAILVRNGKPIAISTDHKPGRPDERARIEALGGRVAITEDESYHPPSRGCLCMRKLFGPNRPLRVFPGGLSVSRTIGDISMKSTQLVISDPEMYTCEITPEDQFMVLACDGVWDVMNNQQVADVVRKQLIVSSYSADAAARTLAKDAYRRGSTDNISVIVVVFNHP